MHENLQKTVARLLAPLVRLLLRHGISHAQFSNWAKQAFVSEAGSHFGVNDKKPTVSRIAIVTGINRKEVKRIQDLPAEVDTSTAKHNRATRVVTGWLQDREFCDANGNPKPLEYGEPENDFNQLVKRYSGDVPARAVLDELLRVGTVERDDNNIVSMKQKGYVPHESEEAMLKILGDSASDLLETIDHNMASEAEDARLQLSVVYDNLSADSVAEFKKLSNRKSMELLQDLDKYLSTQDRDLNPKLKGEGNFRAGLGLYLIEEDLDSGNKAGEQDEN